MEGEILKNLSDILSMLTIFSCVFLKVPQIISIRGRKSAEGTNIQAMIMELIGFSIMSLYNYTNEYSIMTYLEYVIILLQIYVLFYYVLVYKRLLRTPGVYVATTIYFTIIAAFGLNFLPKEVLSFLVPFCTPLSGFAKVSYIYGIISIGNADSVSLTTWIISVATNGARIFTVYVDSGDIKLMMNFFVSAILSGGVLGSAIYYQSYPKVQQRRVPLRKRRCYMD